MPVFRSFIHAHKSFCGLWIPSPDKHPDYHHGALFQFLYSHAHAGWLLLEWAPPPPHDPSGPARWKPVFKIVANNKTADAEVS